MTLLEQYMADYQRVCAEKVALQEQLDAHQAFLAHVSDWRLDKAIELVRSDLPIEGVMRERLLGRLLNIRDHAEQLEATQKVVTAAQRYLAWRHNWPEAHGGLAELGAALAEYDSNPASEPKEDA